MIPQRRRHNPTGTHAVVEDGHSQEQGEKLISSSSSSSISNGDAASQNPNAIDSLGDSDWEKCGRTLSFMDQDTRVRSKRFLNTMKTNSIDWMLRRLTRDGEYECNIFA